MNGRKARAWLPIALVVSFHSALASVPAVAQTPPETAAAELRERIAASFVLALGRLPGPGEIDEWAAKRGTVAELVARHREALQRDGAARQAVAAKAAQDAFGTAAGVRTGASADTGPTYTEVMKNHVEWLAAHAQDYEATIHRAYRLLLQRNAYDIEVDYWKRQPALPFALLVGCVDDWARRNQPGLTATTGVAAVSVNSRYLATVRLSSAVAAEARSAAGLPRDNEAERGLDRHVVAPGAARLVSVGGIHFAAAGGAALTGQPR